MQYAGTWDHLYVTLFGTKGQSERTELNNFGIDFTTGTTGTYTINTSLSLGNLLLVKVEKDPFFILPEDEWYCSKIVPSRYLKEDQPLLIDHRKKELLLRKDIYQWKTMAEGIPHQNNFDDGSELPAEIRFSKSKSTEISNTKTQLGLELILKGLLGTAENWETIKDMKNIFWYKRTTMSEYVAEHWMEDDFYGFQFLNGINPTMIKRCSELPSNFPVTEEMVKSFLEEGSSLEKEMEKGNIFLYDQKKMDGMQGRLHNGERLHVTAGLCLFYMNPNNKLIPIAIQLHQKPSQENPIFLPSDTETDWLLAKMFIKNADTMDHESVHHLMNTHFLAEVYTLATLRNFPVIHPLYKLLFPHFQDTLFVNTIGRKDLMERDQAPFRISSLGNDGMIELMRRSISEMTYSSLCLPENITARGLESIPNFYYRDDGLKLWNIINSFVRAVVEYYYPSDSEVCKDTELQEWISEIFTHGFLGNKDAGFPAGFNTVEEVIKFITMVIFKVTGQHAAVNSGQFDYYSWVPNGSLLLHKPPPTTKGQSSMKTILETLPNVGETVSFAATVWVLSKKYTDTVPMGTYPEERFDEPAIKQMIKEFQAELSYLSEAIQERNSQLEVPYTYLDPAQIENSIAI
ncbi:Arachidonate 12-lipoxygenase, 12R-type [Larimichthys crocea]|uniref:Arachidonate 12-lipoxygenase, 12R-type n=1 Tax=Larimichthys crocea TaxID=215358 RepID=A0A6G0I5S1_LARCR|nr:Arachidonate 12-lipoxygenase, 12R-type [Larimichthys crocea]